MKAKQAGKNKVSIFIFFKEKKEKKNQETSFFIFHEQLKLMDELSVILEFSRILQWKLEVGTEHFPGQKKKKKNQKDFAFYWRSSEE